jgi:hypothetical protein
MEGESREKNIEHAFAGEQVVPAEDEQALGTVRKVAGQHGK